MEPRTSPKRGLIPDSDSRAGLRLHHQVAERSRQGESRRCTQALRSRGSTTAGHGIVHGRSAIRTPSVAHCFGQAHCDRQPAIGLAVIAPCKSDTAIESPELTQAGSSPLGGPSSKSRAKCGKPYEAPVVAALTPTGGTL